ncbi:hypothetical protein ACJW31_03G141200 [Castanea mollissima]
MENGNQPLLSSSREGDQEREHQLQSLPVAIHTSSTATFNADTADIPPIKSPVDFYRAFLTESKKLWYLAGPAIFTSICQYSLGAITQVFLGQVGTLDLAAFSIENSVIAGFSLGIMLGMGSALETLCGQAFGAGQIDMLGIYMQRSWVILTTTAGVFALYMLPQLFAYALNFPMVKFLQSQSKIFVIALIAAVTLALHTVFSWLLILKLGWGLVGAAVVLDSSWWFIVIVQLLYILSGSCGRAWSGFSLKAFHNLWGFVKLSLASAVMLCLEVWYFMALILFAGYLQDAEVSVDALSICMNILGWTIMEALGMNAAISVRVSNELGASHPRTAKFSLVVAVVTSFLIGVIISIILILSRNVYPSLFSSDASVETLVKELTPVLALCIIVNNVQPVLSGVAIGAGWQGIVAYVNIACYYVFGIPLGLILGYKLDWGVTGIWYGMMIGTIVQTGVLFIIVYRTNWNKEASIAEDRIRKWGGPKESDVEKTNES